MVAPASRSAPPSVAVGTMNFGGRTGEEESRRIVARALEAGLRVFDTANVYGDGRSEALLGRALGVERTKALVASKVGMRRVEGRPEGLAPERMLRALDESLSRLGTDHLDLWYLHAPDPNTPIDETLDAVRQALADGRVRAWGISNHAAWQILELIVRCDGMGLPRPSTSQVLYNVLIRQVELEYLRFAARYGLHTTVYNPLAGGILSGSHEFARGPTKGSRFDGNKMYRARYWSQALFARVDDCRELAKRADRSLVSLAYGWLSTRFGVDSVLVGPATVAHLDEAIEGIGRPLPDEVLNALDRRYLEWEGTDARYAR